MFLRLLQTYYLWLQAMLINLSCLSAQNIMFLWLRFTHLQHQNNLVGIDCLPDV